MSRPEDRSLSPRFDLLILFTACMWAAVSCTALGRPSPIFGYRLDAAGSLSVRASMGTGDETWVQSVRETSTAVIVSVFSRNTSTGAGGGVATDRWFPVALRAPLAERQVLDAITNTPVPNESTE